MKYIKIQEIKFVIQSYLVNDFVYLVSEKMSSIRINFEAFNCNQKERVFESNQKTDKSWFDFVNQINVTEVELTLKEKFNPIHHV